MKNTLSILAALLLAPLVATASGQEITVERMRQVYEEIKTSFKYGVVIRGENHNPVDCPSVFRAEDKWFMIYVCMNKVGYETHLAVSDDLFPPPAQA